MNAKTKILDAAELVVLRDGVAHLTLDAVAVEAGLSKGGVLYHFPTKEALVAGMVNHLIDVCNEDLVRSVENDPEPKGRMTRAILAVNFPDPSTERAHHKRVAAAMLAAVLTNRSLLEPVHAAYRNLAAAMEADGIDPVRANIIHLAADGLWLMDLFGVPGPEPERRREIISRLYAMTRE